MRSIFEFSDYREFLKTYLKGAGTGMNSKIAKFLEIQSSMMSQIVSGKKTLSLEKAHLLTRYLEFNDFETEYLICLVQLDSASGPDLKQFFKNQAELIKSRVSVSASFGKQHSKLNETERALFYSTWYYAGIHLLSFIPGFQNVDVIAQRYNMPAETVNQVIEFLVQSGLCVKKGNRISPGSVGTYIKGDMVNKSRHHLNWRLKAMDKLSIGQPQNFFFSIPMSVSEEDSKLIKQMIWDVISKINAMVPDSPPEKLYCLNVDWFEF